MTLDSSGEVFNETELLELELLGVVQTAIQATEIEDGTIISTKRGSMVSLNLVAGSFDFLDIRIPQGLGISGYRIESNDDLEGSYGLRVFEIAVMPDSHDGKEHYQPAELSSLLVDLLADNLRTAIFLELAVDTDTSRAVYRAEQKSRRLKRKQDAYAKMIGAYMLIDDAMARVMAEASQFYQEAKKTKISDYLARMPIPKIFSTRSR